MMICDRLVKLLYTSIEAVNDNELAPVRMMDKVNQHISNCPSCSFTPETCSMVVKIIQSNLPKGVLKLRLESALNSWSACPHIPSSIKTSITHPSAYHILGLEGNEPEEQVKKTYRALAMQHHPDRNAGAKECNDLFLMIKDAYETIAHQHVAYQY